MIMAKSIFTSVALSGLLSIASIAEAGTVRVTSDAYDPNIISNFYNSYGGNTSQVLAGTIDTFDLTGVNLLWAVQPGDSYTVGEIAAMANYLANGGRIAFMGEHGQFAPNQNNRINAALTALGSTIQIVNTIEDSSFRSASTTDGQIVSHPLTQGVNTYQYAAFAPLTVSGSAQVLMLGEDNPSSVMMAYQNIGAGSIFLITDQNVWDNAATLWGAFDNEVMFANLVSAVTVTPTIPEPSTWAMMLLGFGMVGAASRYRRRSIKAVYA